MQGWRELVREDVVKIFELSEHSRRGLTALGTTAAHHVVRNLLSTHGSVVAVGDIAKNAAGAATKAFVTSVATDRLTPFLGDASGRVTAGAVNAGFALAMGDKAAAQEIAFESVVNVVLDKVAAKSPWIGLNYGASTYVPRGTPHFARLPLSCTSTQSLIAQVRYDFSDTNWWSHRVLSDAI